MFAIGEFARIGRVSVRMLRHYDEIGLLHPASVDRSTGYRSYAPSQIPTLHRIVALKDLGFSLDQIRELVNERIGPDELRDMLRLRRSQIETEVREATQRLARLDHRLHLIETEDTDMPTIDVVVKALPAVRVAELTGWAEGYGPEHIGPVIQPLYPRLFEAIGQAGVTPAGPTMAYYEEAQDGGVVVHATVAIDAAPAGNHVFTVTDLPVVERAATAIHNGSMEFVGPTYEALLGWIDANGYVPIGFSREVDLACMGDPANWITELQFAIDTK